MLYLDPDVMASMGGSTDAEIARPVIHDPVLAAMLCRLFDRLDAWSAGRCDVLACEQSLVAACTLVLGRHAVAAAQDGSRPGQVIARPWRRGRRGRRQLPVPSGTPVIDLALTRGVPSFAQVLDTLLSEMQVERAEHAAEMLERSPQLAALLREALPGVPLSAIDHASFKQRRGAARAVVRSGECTPYANVMLFAGVVF